MAGLRIGHLRPEVIQALTRTPEIKKQLRTVANEIRKEARQLAPKESGALRRGISVDNVLNDKGEVEFRVGYSPRVFYGSLVELGTSEHPATPHLRPAALKVGGKGGRRAVAD